VTKLDGAPRTRTLLALLVSATLAVPALLQPARAGAFDGCCTYSQDVWYYSDAAHTPPAAGFCQFNQACSGQDVCSGVQTDYYVAMPPGCCINCPD
jgi:hypothetical protein